MRSAAVVGAGLAGLAAATQLKQAGWRVELFERSRLLGGRATSFEVEGRVVDNGQHVYLACCTEFVRFVERIGMGHALHLQDRFSVAVYDKNGVRSELRAADLPPPLHLFASFVRYRHISFAGKIRIAFALLALMLDPAGARDDLSFARWLQQHRQSRDTLRAFWEPFMVPALNAPLDRMSAAQAAFVLSTAFLHDRDGARFGYCTVALAEIMENAAAALDAVHRSSAVLAFDADEHRVVLRTAQTESRFDAAVLAVSPRALARLVGEHSRLGLAQLDAYEPFPIMDVHLWHDGAGLDGDFAAILDSPVQWVFQKAPGYLCASMSAAANLIAKPTSEVVALAWNEVCRALPNFAGARLVLGAATRNPEGTYLASPGTVRPQAQGALANVAVAGAWTDTGWPDTMESAVRSGLRAAQVLERSACAGTFQQANDLTHA